MLIRPKECINGSVLRSISYGTEMCEDVHFDLRSASMAHPATSRSHAYTIATGPDPFPAQIRFQKNMDALRRVDEGGEGHDDSKHRC